MLHEIEPIDSAETDSFADEHENHSEEEEEDECRVCRGPAEEGCVVIFVCMLLVMFAFVLAW